MFQNKKDKKEIELQENKLAEKRKTVAAYKRFFETSNGKLILKDLRETCNVDRPSFDEDIPDSNIAIFNEGKRAVFLHITTRTNTDVRTLKEV